MWVLRPRGGESDPLQWRGPSHLGVEAEPPGKRPPLVLPQLVLGGWEWRVWDHGPIPEAKGGLQSNPLGVAIKVVKELVHGNLSRRVCLTAVFASRTVLTLVRS